MCRIKACLFKKYLFMDFRCTEVLTYTGNDIIVEVIIFKISIVRLPCQQNYTTS